MFLDENGSHVMLSGSGVVSLCFVERMSWMYPVESTSLDTVFVFNAPHLYDLELCQEHPRF